MEEEREADGSPSPALKRDLIMAWNVRKPILVPYDFSSHSRLAVDKALALADSPSCVHVLHVLPSFVPLAPEGFPLESIDDSVRLDSAQKSLEEDFADQRYAGVAREVLIGDPGTVCADRAETLDAELLVVPSHGRSGVSRLLLGSVAERIIRLSKRPVLVLKIPHD
jgi:nucleotide-binding universal stress UspA family protein